LGPYKKLMALLRITILAFSLALFCLGANAQGTRELHFQLLDTAMSKARFEKKVSYKKKISPAKEEEELRSVLFQLQERGYLTASIDSVYRDSLHTTAFITTGNVYKWARLQRSKIDEEILIKTGFREKIYRNKKISPSQLVSMEEKMITYCENNGFPFASVQLDSVVIIDDKVDAKLLLTKNMLVKIDSIVIKGGAKISKRYICNYIGISEKDLYREVYVSGISNRLQELPFVKETKPFNIIFTEKYSKLVLYLENKKANRFDGILGFLPDDKTGKLLITGQAHLQLLNSFAHGELIDIDWRKLQPLSQDFTAVFNYPFVLNTPFGADLHFKLYKKDTTFTDVTQNAGVQYLLRGGNYLKVFVSNRNTSLISTKGLENIVTLPPYADVKVISYGLGIKNDHLDYRINPRKGYRINTSGSIGNKNILQNPKINPAAYSTLQLRSVQYNFSLATELFIPVLRRSTLDFGLRSEALFGSNTFENELLRFGGLNTLRGFDEESINASGFVIANLEYRYLFEKNSNLFMFFNGCYYEKSTVNTYLSDTPFGFGAGIHFQTKPGIFTLTYALGKQLSNPILLRSAKIHFGIISVF